MKRTVLAALLVAASLLPAQARDISGRYTVQGNNIDGSEYEGTAEIASLSDATCAIVWKIVGREFDGICMHDGDIFSAAYEIDGEVGLLIYHIGPNGSMEGSWTIAGERGRGAEVLMPEN
jgi:hypothetical protein